jgi:hypothetical protein
MFVYLVLPLIAFNLWQCSYMTWLYCRRPEAWNLFVKNWAMGSNRKIRPVRFLVGLWLGFWAAVAALSFFYHYVLSEVK